MRRWSGIRLLVAATVVILTHPIPASSQCPVNTISLEARSTGAFLSSTNPTGSKFHDNAGATAYGSWNLVTGITKVSASATARGTTNTHDTYQITGLPAGTPVTFQANLEITGSLSAFVGSAGAFFTIREGASNSATYTNGVSASTPPHTASIFTTLTVTISTTVGTPVDLFVLSQAQATEGGGADFGSFTPGTNGARVYFSGFPPGATITSCQGFSQFFPTPVVTTTWGAIKAGH